MCGKLFAASITLATSASFAVAETLRYHLVDLGPPAFLRDGRGRCNSLGWVQEGTFLYRPGIGWTSLPLYPGFEKTIGYDINDRGYVALLLQKNGANSPGYWSPAEGIVKFEVPPSMVYNETRCMNGHGEIAGNGIDPDQGFLKVWLFRPGQPTIDLGRCPFGPGGDPRDINDEGIIAGEHRESDGQPGVNIVLRDGTWINIGHPEGFDFLPQGIDGQGNIVGSSFYAGPNYWNRQTGWQDLGHIEGTMNVLKPNCVNTAGWVVGRGETLTQSHAFLWRPSVGLSLLDDLIDDSKTGWTIGGASGIAENGIITGWAHWQGDQPNKWRSILLYPNAGAGVRPEARRWDGNLFSFRFFPGSG